MREFPPPAIDAALGRMPRRRKIFEALRTCDHQEDLFKCDGCSGITHALQQCHLHATGFVAADRIYCYCLDCARKR